MGDDEENVLPVAPPVRLPVVRNPASPARRALALAGVVVLLVTAGAVLLFLAFGTLESYDGITSVFGLLVLGCPCAGTLALPAVALMVWLSKHPEG